MKTTKQNKLPQYFLEKPNLNKVDKSKIYEKLVKSGEDQFREHFERANEPKYLNWDKLKYKNPRGLTPEEFWFLVRSFRNVAARKTRIKTEKGEYFVWIRLPYTEEFLHRIDISSGGQIFASLDVLSDSNKQKFISRGILEEAIASSQLEGAHTTRQVAKRMIVEKREPRNQSEQMILNNYNTIVAIEEDYKNKPLSKELLIELHAMLTDKTVSEDELKRFRRDEDRIVVQGQIGTDQYITHIPPKQKFVSGELDRLINYANDIDDASFTHPIVKAIFLHFWVGYLHPFTDGNGRLARALFYWYLLRKDYWTFMYLPISTIIKKAPSQYALAYIYSEQDSHDATYFFDFHIRKIMQSLRDFNDYITTKINENRQIDKIVSKDLKLNDRQKFLLHHLISDKDAYTTVTSHKTMNNVSRQTAAKDIKELEKVGLIVSERHGKYINYSASDLLSKQANRL